MESCLVKLPHELTEASQRLPVLCVRLLIYKNGKEHKQGPEKKFVLIPSSTLYGYGLTSASKKKCLMCRKLAMSVDLELKYGCNWPMHTRNSHCQTERTEVRSKMEKPNETKQPTQQMSVPGEEISVKGKSEWKGWELGTEMMCSAVQKEHQLPVVEN